MNKIDKEKLIETKREGKSDSECAKVFGCSQAAVSEMRRRLEAAGRMTSATISNAEDYIEEKHLQTEADEEICHEPVVPIPAEKKHKTVAEYLAAEEAEETAKLKEAVPVDLPVGNYADVVFNPELAGRMIPPIDRRTFWTMRRDELRSAICEYACEGLRVDPEWVEEYNELVERCGR